jgi:hypothetical protein
LQLVRPKAEAAVRSWFVHFKREEKMKNIGVCKSILSIFFCALVFWLSGCFEQPGETAAEGHRRHLRNLRVNQQELMQDVDKVMLSDQPSKLTDKNIP